MSLFLMADQKQADKVSKAWIIERENRIHQGHDTFHPDCLLCQVELELDIDLKMAWRAFKP